MPKETDTPYSELGKLLDRLARARDVRGPNAIAKYIRKKTGEGPGRAAWGQALYGDTYPTRKNHEVVCGSLRARRGGKRAARGDAPLRRIGSPRYYEPSRHIGQLVLASVLVCAGTRTRDYPASCKAPITQG